MNIQHHTYRSSTVSSLFTAHHSQAANYAFASKERDTETGLSVTSLRSVSSLPLGHFRTSSNGTRWLRRFGARYYCSELSIWLSVDPMVDKYPSLSPYVYCANNPVKLVDPNGEDIITVDQQNGKTTITKQAGNDVLVCGRKRTPLSGNGVYAKEGSVLRYDHNHLRTDTDFADGWPSTPENKAKEGYVDTDAWKALMARNPNVTLGIRHRKTTTTYIRNGEIKDNSIQKYMKR